MSKKRSQSWLALIVLLPGLLILAIAGLFVYMSATAIPIHPDAQKVRSVSKSVPQARWTAAVAEARQVARATLTEQNLPGLSVAVGAGGVIVWAEGFGWADLEKRTEVTPDTRFRIGDVSVPLTSAAAGLLIETDALKPDDEIQTYVPDFPRKEWPVTVRQLMGQVGGIHTDEGDEEPLSPCGRTAEGLERFEKDRLLFEPGSRFHPSSYGWILVSAAVEAAAHAPFFTFMRTHVFEPLGMADTRPDSANDAGPNQATFYFPRFAGDTRYGPEPAREGDHSCFAGAGAFLSTASDLVRFGLAISNGKILQPATVALLQTSQHLTSGEETGYGLGWNVETVTLANQPARMAGHGTKKDFIGGTTYLMTIPDRGLVVAVTSNISFADTKDIALKIAQAFAGR